ncbi:anaerobic ribonucleoside-triphosphate reductase [bacterium Unc6]|nr:anaerobic ribonucleoside-triphosphate reductase [bacterium Unc6]
MTAQTILKEKEEKQTTTSAKYFTQVRKRDGRLVTFDRSKIADAIFKAAKAVGGEDRLMAEEIANAVTLYLKNRFQKNIPEIEQIQDIVEKVLIETGHAKTAKAYIIYRKKRQQTREQMRVRHYVRGKTSSTDVSLLVTASSRHELLSWDKARIAGALQKEAQIEEGLSWEIASKVEQRIINSGLTVISTSLIRELVDNELFEKGLTKKISKTSVIGMPVYDLEQLVFSKTKENSNITSNNPEAINLAIAENTLKQYALQSIFSSDIADAHLKGAIHIHDLGYPTRVYCSSHSLEYIKKYGLTHICNLDTSSAPAKHARTLTGHLNTFLASMQAYYAGALGIGYLNILLAPYLEGMTYKEMKQEAQHLIFSGSQNAFSRGGQSLFIDFNIHTGVPEYLKNIPAIGPDGKYTGKTYKDYETISQEFCKAMLDVWKEGDMLGRPFAFPKADFHVSEETFEDPKQFELFKAAGEVASTNGSVYFVFDRGSQVVLSMCCRLRQKINDKFMIEHPESMRFCGFQNVTVNLPQAAYRAQKNNLSQLYKEIDHMIEICVRAHLQKKQFIASLMKDPHMPLWQIGKPAQDGRPYVDLDKCTYIIGLIGLNECVQFITGEELHQSDLAFLTGLKIVARMYLKIQEQTEKTGLRFSLEESPAESATRRLAKVDLKTYPESAASVVRGSIENDTIYYTNSIHLRADAPVDIVTRIEKQSKFHNLIESGAIIHAFVGEQMPSAQSILNLVEKTFYKSSCAQLTISPEFSICNNCGKVIRGIHSACVHCLSKDIYSITRIVGYYSRINNWNPSKLAELEDRHSGDYKVAN